MGETEDGRLPLGTLRQAAMKLESFATDIREVLEEEGLTDDERHNFEVMVEMAGTMLASLVMTVSSEIGEEEFLAETPAMDEIDPYPGTEVPVEDQEIE